jgi:hypothetical protein
MQTRQQTIQGPSHIELLRKQFKEPHASTVFWMCDAVTCAKTSEMATAANHKNKNGNRHTMMFGMKASAILLITLLFLSVSFSLVRCDDMFINSQLWLTQDNASHSWDGDLKNGDHISVSVTVINGDGKVSFHVLNSHDEQLVDQTNIGTEGWQRQWTVPYDDSIEFVVELTSGTQAIVNVQVTLTGTDDGTQQGGNGGFDPTPIIIIVVILVAVLISLFFILRLRKQLPPPPPTEGIPPPPP